MNSRRIVLCIFTCSVLFPLTFFACQELPEKYIEIRGIYGNPKPYWDKEIILSNLGVNSIFVHSGSISMELMKRAKADGLKVFAEFATLNGKNYVNNHPEAWAIDNKGNKVDAASWFMGVCPTEPGFRLFRQNQLKSLLQEFELDGIWMDYVHWHAQFEEPEPILPETCFCDHCLNQFSSYTSLELPEGSTTIRADWVLENHDQAWRKWRCLVISDWAKDFREIIKEKNSEILLGLYHCPWDDQEYDSARIRILGLDYNLLRETIDVFSPMVYHGRMGREPEWVEENISWFCKSLDIQQDSYPKVWPIVQAYDDPKTISSEEFKTVLLGGLSSKSTGVMMFTTHSMAQSEEKTEVMKNIYLHLSK